MSANRLIANQRLTAILELCRRENPDLQYLDYIKVDHEDNADDDTIQTLKRKGVGVIGQPSSVLLFNRHWVACQEDNDLKIEMARILMFSKRLEPKPFGSRLYDITAARMPCPLTQTRDRLLVLADQIDGKGCILSVEEASAVAADIRKLISSALGL